MDDLVFVASLSLVAGFGLWTWRLDSIRSLDGEARLSIAFTAGLVVLSVLMFAMTLVHLAWSRLAFATLLLGAVLIARPWSITGRGPWRRSLPRTGALGVALLLVYGALSARITCADLLFFWAPKGARFHLARAIDPEFLRFPHYLLMHPDYPPLLPSAYAFGATAAHGVSLVGALLLTPMMLIVTVAAFRGLAAPKIGEVAAGRYGLVLAAMFALLAAGACVGGGADPLVWSFATIAVSALVFDDSAGGRTIASVALAGAVFTKVEGLTILGIVVVAYFVTSRRGKSAAGIAVAPIALVGSWIAWASHHQLLAAYTTSLQPLRLDRLVPVLWSMLLSSTYQTYWLPWIAAIALVAGIVQWKRAALPLLVAAGTIVVAVYFYLHSPDARFWIGASAERILGTTVLLLVVAAAAGSSEAGPAADVGPRALGTASAPAVR